MSIKKTNKVIEILDATYERIYPYELEKNLAILFKEAEEKLEDIKQVILWEIDLLNRTVGHKGTYKGEEVEEISNKWNYYLKADVKNFTKPFSNTPFCDWKEKAIDYYKKRLLETKSELSKARYSFAIMTFSKDSEKLVYAKQSTDAWLKTAEKYISEGVYSKEYYEIPSFAYEFALKLSISFSQKELINKILESLHKSIFKMINEGDKRWNLELFRLESLYISQLSSNPKIKEESKIKLKEIIFNLREEKKYHFLREYISCLEKYVSTSEEYDLKRDFANSFIQEAEERNDPLVKASFYRSAIQVYKEMQGKFRDKKEETDKNIEELNLKIKSANNDIRYKKFSASINITDKNIEDFISQLKSKGSDLFFYFLEDESIFPRIDLTKKQTEKNKEDFPLQFIMPVDVIFNENTVKSHISEESIYDYHYRKNILMGLKLGEIFLNMVLNKIKDELDLKKEIEKIIQNEDIKDIRKTIEKGLISAIVNPGDPISAIHILTPYIEEIIRRIIVKNNMVDNIILWERQQTTKQKTINFRKIELGGLLINEEVRKIIGEDFSESIKIYFSDEDQENLRNLLSHGLISSEYMKESNSQFVAYVILKLLIILNKPKQIKA